ncbi:hypothetical protein K402DRAFT_450831 [Aulographum hederae CBS 113979]|uniref:Uncharacterized protein n=1 Tax=Aulographum hederae CBS 113979 TaxID=1176131 RepID=A0A6G1HDA3_9PEZI|nr:hypothetical protein K402DRAFT_450831 [Aulographum hederae CBS 113979]
MTEKKPNSCPAASTWRAFSNRPTLGFMSISESSFGCTRETNTRTLHHPRTLSAQSLNPALPESNMFFPSQLSFGPFSDSSVGTPIIFFDSHPEEQDSYLYSYWSSLKTAVHGGITGDVEKALLPGTLRIVYWTEYVRTEQQINIAQTDNDKAHADYELHQYALARSHFYNLLSHPDVRRCLVTGFSGQNPYVTSNDGSSLWTEQEKIIEMEKKKQARRAKAAEEKKKRMEGKLVDVDGDGEEEEEGKVAGDGLERNGIDKLILDVEEAERQSREREAAARPKEEV